MPPRFQPLWLFRAFAVLVVLVATLRPGGPEPALTTWFDCIICGARGLAEVIQNVLLFIPFGLFFLLGGGRLGRVVAMGAALSLTVEMIQQFLPGRDPSAADVFFNTAGTLVGALLGRITPGLIEPGPRAPWLALWWALGASAIIAATGSLLRTRDTLPVEIFWTPDVPVLPTFPGRVLSARIGKSPVGEGPVREPAVMASALREGKPIEVTLFVRKTPWNRDFAPIWVALASADVPRPMLAGTPDDLGFWPHTIAATWTLDQPPHRIHGALTGLAAGDTVQLTAERQPAGYCMAALVRGETRGRCGLRYSAAQGWALVRYPRSMPLWMEQLFGVSWLAALAFPVGFWTRAHRVAIAALIVWGAAVLVVPQIAGLGAKGLVELGAVAAGTVIGAVLQGGRGPRGGMSLPPSSNGSSLPPHL